MKSYVSGEVKMRGKAAKEIGGIMLDIKGEQMKVLK
jgi:hypothetical protein